MSAPWSRCGPSWTSCPEGGRTPTSSSNTNAVDPRCPRVLRKHRKQPLALVPHDSVFVDASPCRTLPSSRLRSRFGCERQILLAIERHGSLCGELLACAAARVRGCVKTRGQGSRVGELDGRPLGYRLACRSGLVRCDKNA